MSQKRIYSHSSIVQHLEGWGRSHNSADDAKRELLKDIDVSGAAMIALLGKLFEIGEVLRPSPVEDDEESDERPSDARKLDGVVVGTVLYSFDCEEGLSTVVVVSIDDDGYPRVCYQWLGAKAKYLTQYSGDWHRDVASAVRHQVAEDLKYHLAELARAEKAIAMLEAGEDLTDGVPDQDESSGDEDAAE